MSAAALTYTHVYIMCVEYKQCIIPLEQGHQTAFIIIYYEQEIIKLINRTPSSSGSLFLIPNGKS